LKTRLEELFEESAVPVIGLFPAIGFGSVPFVGLVEAIGFGNVPFVGLVEGITADELA
jgi:hypothetical protein